MFSAFGWAYLALQVWGGWLSDKFGARLTLTVCGIIWAGSTMLIGFVGSFAALIVCRVILGLGEGATFPTATRAWRIGFLRKSAALPRALRILLPDWEISSLLRWSHFSSAWFLAALFRGAGRSEPVWSVVWWFYFRDNPATHRGITPEELGVVPDYAAKKDRKKDPVPWKALTFRMAPVTLVYFCYGWTLWLYLTWLPQFFMHGYKLNLKNSALFSSGVFLAGVIGDTVGGVVSDRILIKTETATRRDATW